MYSSEPDTFVSIFYVFLIIAGIVLLLWLILTATFGIFKLFLRIPERDQAIVVSGYGVPDGSQAYRRPVVILPWQKGEPISLGMYTVEVSVSTLCRDKTEVFLDGTVSYSANLGQLEVYLNYFSEEDEEGMIKAKYGYHLSCIISMMTESELAFGRDQLRTRVHQSLQDEVAALGIVIHSVDLGSISKTIS